MNISEYIWVRFNRITITGYSHTTHSWVYVSYLCDCWKSKITLLSRIRRWIKSCWCYKPYQATHWMYWTKLYKVFDSIKQRIYNPNHEFYSNYGWRWLTCEWSNFNEFYKDMGDSYKDGLSIDRINNDIWYSKENCRWITMDAQQRNRRNNVVYSAWWLSMCLSEWSRYLWMSRYRSERLLQKGWSQLDFIMLMDWCDLKTAINKLSHI